MTAKDLIPHPKAYIDLKTDEVEKKPLEMTKDLVEAIKGTLGV